MIAREVVRGCQAVTTTADDDDVIALLEPRWVAEHAGVWMPAAQGVFQETVGHPDVSCMTVNTVAYG
jgi:hypothetical protein